MSIFFIFNYQTIMLIFFLTLLILPKTSGKFLFDSGTSSIIVVRHIRLITDNEYYRIRCPYHLKHLTLKLLNYSNDHCFDLYTESFSKDCRNYRSPCQFHAKPVRLDCPDRIDSNHVDITYQCSFLPSTSTNTTLSIDQETSSFASTPPSADPITLHALSFPSTLFGLEESIGIFIIGLATVFILWFTVCCIWFIRCGHINDEDDDDDDDDGGKCELLSFRPYQKSDPIDFTILSQRNSMIVGNLFGHTSTGGIENICLHINPLENKRISSLKLTQID